MHEYHWEKGSANESALIADTEWPARVAIANTAIVVQSNALLLCNAHPETWNNWLLPYATVTAELTDAQTFRSLADVTALLLAQRREKEKEISDQTRSQIESMIGAEVNLDDDPAFSSFALRYSKSADVWTAYSFAYFRASLDPGANLADHLTLVPLTESSVNEIVKTKTWEGFDVSDAVVEMLRDEKRRPTLESAR